MIGLESQVIDAFSGVDPVPTRFFTPTNGFQPELGNLFPEIFRGRINQIDRGQRLPDMKKHLGNFSERCLTLKSISEQQLAGLNHSTAMKAFLKNTVEDFEIIGYVGERLYNGWFPGLYFENVRQPWGGHPSSTWNPVVVDVHTDSRDICSGDPGAILHEGTGRVQFMLTSVKHADGSSCAYGGPVMSHYEFTTPPGIRKSDEQWKLHLEKGNEPTFDTWKHSYLVPEEGG